MQKHQHKQQRKEYINLTTILYQKKHLVIHLKQKQAARAAPVARESIASRVEKEIDGNAYYRKAIELGITNYSALAEKILEKTGGSKEAVKIAVARYAEKHCSASENSLKHVKNLLKNTSISLEDDITVLITEKNLFTEKVFSSLQESEVKSVVSSSNSTTIVCKTREAEKIEKTLQRTSIVKKHHGLCLIQLSSPVELEETPGAIVFILDSLAKKNINVVEFSSCYTDTNIIVERKDALKSFEALEEACGK